MKRKLSKMSIASIIMIIISIIAGYNLYKKMSPNGEQMDLYEYYGLDKNDTKSAAIVLEDGVCKDENKKSITGMIDEEDAYLDCDVLCKKISTQFFWDEKNNKLIVTTPNSIMDIQEGKNSYTVNGEDKNFDKVIVKNENDKRYVSLSFAQAVCKLDCNVEKNPNRLVCNYSWGKQEKVVKVEMEGAVRYKADDKAKILTKVKKGEVLKVLTEKQYISPSFLKVLTDNGCVGYIRKGYISDEKNETKEASKELKGPEYKQNTDGKKVCLGWFYVKDNEPSSKRSDDLKNANEVNVVSPTWMHFKKNVSDGSIEGHSEKSMVDKFHSEGKKVWVCVQDFDPEDTDVLPPVYDTLSDTETRRKIEDNIINEVNNCGADGINIDFEQIHKKEDNATSSFYIQFLRELKAKCGDKVLSVDSYVPFGHKEAYRIDEQAKFCDYVVIMAYDEYTDGDGKEDRGSTSSIGWVKRAISESFKEGVNNHKLVIGLPFFSYMYDMEGENVKGTAKPGIKITNRFISEDSVKWDKEKEQYYIKYTLEGGNYEGWIDESKSMQIKLAELQKNNVAGVGFWKLGFDNEKIWEPISEYMKQPTQADGNNENKDANN